LYSDAPEFESLLLGFSDALTVFVQKKKDALTVKDSRYKTSRSMLPPAAFAGLPSTSRHGITNEANKHMD
jgi:hypothetical protein